jgi:hypothetical protein
MNKVIEFYVPAKFQKNPASRPDSQKAKIIEFRAVKSA